MEVKNDPNKFFGNVRKSDKIMFSFVAFFLQIRCKSQRTSADEMLSVAPAEKSFEPNRQRASTPNRFSFVA